MTLGKTSALSDSDPGMHRASATLALGSARLDDDFVLVTPVTHGPKKKKVSGTNSPSVPSTDSDKFYAIIEMQSFKGRWEFSNELLDIMGLDGSMSQSLDGTEMTMLVIGFLEEKMGGERDVWMLVVEKARAWMQSSSLEKGRMEDMERETV